jgi:hypothetical protein
LVQLRLDGQAAMMLAETALDCLVSRKTGSEIKSSKLRLQHGMVSMTNWALLFGQQKKLCENYKLPLQIYQKTSAPL